MAYIYISKFVLLLPCQQLSRGKQSKVLYLQHIDDVAQKLFIIEKAFGA